LKVFSDGADTTSLGRLDNHAIEDDDDDDDNDDNDDVGVILSQTWMNVV